MKASATTYVIIAFALAIWVFFYVTTEPLKLGETTFVVAMCAAIVLSVKWLWNRLGKTRSRE